MQRQKMLSLSIEENYGSLIILTQEVKGKLNWLVQNLHPQKGKTLVSTSAQLVIASDASLRGWRTFCLGQKSLKTLDSFRKKESYNFFGTEGCQIRNFGFHSHVSKGEISSYSNEQHSCPFLFSKNGGYTEQNLNYLEHGNMGVFIGQGDHDYCRVPSRISEQGNRFSVQNCEGFKRVEVKTANISIHLPRTGKARHRPLCITSVSPGSNLYVMETRSFKQRKGCVSDLLCTPKRVRFSPVLTDRSCIKQSSMRTSNSDLSNNSMASIIMVSKTITNICENTSVGPEGYRTFIRSEQGNSSISRKRKLATPGVDGLLKKFWRRTFRRICRSYHKCKANRYKHSLRIG